jgi:hypothetical protein
VSFFTPLFLNVSAFPATPWNIPAGHSVIMIEEILEKLEIGRLLWRTIIAVPGAGGGSLLW